MDEVLVKGSNIIIVAINAFGFIDRSRILRAPYLAAVHLPAVRNGTSLGSGGEIVRLTLRARASGREHSR